MLRYLIILLCSLAISVINLTNAAAASLDLYPFATTQQDKQFHSLIKELRCLVCQNEDLADSNAALAQDLRQQVYQMIQAGKKNTQIKTYLVTRYGDFILFKPPLASRTYVLWFTPALLLLCGSLVLWRVTKMHRG